MVPKDWAGKSLKQLNLRKKGINVIGTLDGDSIEMNIDPDMPLPADEPLLIVAKNDILSKIV